MGKGTVKLTIFERNAAIFMAFVCAISLLAVTSWLFNQPILASLSSEYILMSPVTALIFLGLCSTWRISPKVFQSILVRVGMDYG